MASEPAASARLWMSTIGAKLLTVKKQKRKNSKKKPTRRLSKRILRRHTHAWHISSQYASQKLCCNGSALGKRHNTLCGMVQFFCHTSTTSRQTNSSTVLAVICDSSMLHPAISCGQLCLLPGVDSTCFVVPRVQLCRSRLSGLIN